MVKIVGITSCPAGLAHTPMAAKALEKAGTELGYDVKIEQQGSLGQINKITSNEVADCDLVIFATDQKVTGEERFAGKPIVRVNISTCIKAPKAVLQKVVQSVQEKQK